MMNTENLAHDATPDKSSQTPQQPARWQTVLGVVLGIVIISIMLLLIWQNKTIDSAQYALLKTILAVGVAGVAALFLGQITIQGKINQLAIRAGGAFAVFVLVLVINPALPTTDTEKASDATASIATEKSLPSETTKVPAEKDNTNITQTINNGFQQEFHDHSKAINTINGDINVND